MISSIKKNWRFIVVGLVCVILIILLSLREKIVNNKFAKAKIEMPQAIKDQDMDRLKQIIDSL